MLFLAAFVLVAGNANAFQMSLGPGSLGTGDGVTDVFDQLEIYAQTSSTNNGNGTFSDIGDVVVTGFLPPPVVDDEGYGSYAWQIYGGWTNLGGTVTQGINEAGNPAMFFNYTTGTLNLYASAGVPYDFGSTVGSGDDTGFVGQPGDLIATLTLIGGTGDLDLVTLSGDILLDWQFTYMAPGFWLDQYGNDLSLLPYDIHLMVDTNTDDVVIDPQTGAIISSHNGSADIVVPEPASLALMASGLFGLFGFRRKRA